MQHVPENTMPEEPDGRQDVHNSGVDTQMAAAHLCGQTDLRTGRTCSKAARHHGTCEFIPKDAALEVADDPNAPPGGVHERNLLAPRR